MDEKKIVLLIDAENTSAKFADGILDYISSKGDIISAQIYGDFIDNKNTKQWNGKAVEYNLQRYQADTTKAGKNAADIALVIDAMDFLYKENPADIFCIVTSDGDFTSLVERIRKEGITVIGMGKEDASPRLRRACSEYVELDGSNDDGNDSRDKSSKKSGKKSGLKDDEKNAAGKSSKKSSSSKSTSGKNSDKSEDKQNNKKDKQGKDGREKEKKAASGNVSVSEQYDSDKADNKHEKLKEHKEKNNKAKENKEKTDKEKNAAKKNVSSNKRVPLKNIKMFLNQLVQQDENQGKLADLGGIKSRLQLKFSGFDEHNYGYRSIRELIDSETKFLVIQEGNQAYVISEKKAIDHNEEADVTKDADKNEVKEETKEMAVLEQVCEFILDQYPDKKIGRNEVGSLGRKLKAKFNNFDYKEFGYSKLGLFLSEMGMDVL